MTSAAQNALVQPPTARYVLQAILCMLHILDVFLPVQTEPIMIARRVNVKPAYKIAQNAQHSRHHVRHAMSPGSSTKMTALIRAQVPSF